MDAVATDCAVRSESVENMPPSVVTPRSIIESARSTADTRNTSGLTPNLGGHGPGSAPPTMPEDDPRDHSVAAAPTYFNRNPLVGSNRSFATDPQGKYWYMGPTSSWSFCQRILGMIGAHISEEEPVVNPWALESIPLKWNPIGLDEPPEVGSLPSFEYATLLLSTVNYHLGSLYGIINHEYFCMHMEMFYRDPAKEAQESRFWYAQFLLVLAFGEAFISVGSTQPIAGLNYAVRGLSLLPCFSPLQKNSLAAVEALCLAALYVQALDSRLISFQLIGQALRICVIEGWHRHMSALQVTSSHAKRCTTIFWTAYMIDREFGTLIGAPCSIRDEDITVDLCDPSQSNPGKTEALALQVQMARLTAKILTGIYGVDRSARGTLLVDIQSALHGIALVKKELGSYLDTRFKATDIRTSKIATNLTLSYHHCVVLATRPLVVCALHKSLARVDCSVQIQDGSVRSLLQSCTDSALNILRILKALGDNNMVDHLLSLQLETAFSSAVVLYVIDKLLPGFLTDNSWLQAAHEIFDIMVSKGSLAAPLRSREFQHLQQKMDSYMRKPSQERTSSSSRRDSGLQETDLRSDGEAAGWLESFASWGPLEHHSDFTLSADDLLNLADGLEADEFLVQD
ncbi:hypothetical protein N7519_008081 [Penicillium mononematosum]|uniref:uncharacterized protein n=1 Tax=Penicillium mononematosum TaxID=268346 RepID=UPI002546C345|nr:uncharacterized protein N7519_008081 [Penicillium mononematosum]KAJ6186780.1 hypothetical protein N7519_008081 [Penicillium mononematosum]